MFQKVLKFSIQDKPNIYQIFLKISKNSQIIPELSKITKIKNCQMQKIRKLFQKFFKNPIISKNSKKWQKIKSVQKLEISSTNLKIITF